MTTTVFSDELINSTQLRTQQKRWLDKAFIEPVSILSGEKQLVLINRDTVKDIFAYNHYASMVIQFCQEQKLGKKNESKVFPWIKHLNDNETMEFTNELLASFLEVVHTKEWNTLEELAEDWIATAEVKSNPDLVEALLTKGDPSAHVRVQV